MVEQISGSSSPDTIIDQMFPTFHSNFNLQNAIINNNIISYENNVALEVWFIVLGRTWFQVILCSNIFAIVLYPKR